MAQLQEAGKGFGKGMLLAAAGMCRMCHSLQAELRPSPHALQYRMYERRF